ncbi:PAS domain-containing hybrid sensor histidine kinase/response regulator [Azospirillum soli]|uniref:PAS domain-containing hybrid sensor histidine kinase/response regulator n=1 Tax=Azospirillum soli TaxID=1304799 RepID=UPI001AE20CA4|nr:PAS domain S-box protein [Azospirillum soli]MBP2314139.1 PAS domain S-box-containing protein [Azospirillum soli]
MPDASPDLILHPYAAALLQSRVAAVLVFDVAPDGSGFLFRSLNRRCEELTGLDPRHTVGSMLAEILTSDDALRLEQRLFACVETRRPLVVEERLSFPRGTGWWEIELTPVFSELDERVQQILAVGVDVTARHELAQRPRAATPPLHAVFDTPFAAVVTMNREHRITLFNKGAEQLFGYRESEVLGRPIDLLIPTRFREGHRRHVEGYAQSAQSGSRIMGEPRDLVGLHRDGTEIPLEGAVSKHVEAGGVRFSVVLRDARRSLAAERALATRERLLGAVAENLNGVFLRRVRDRLGRWRFDYVSSGAEALFGCRPEEILADPGRLLDLVHPDDRDLFQAALDVSARDLSRLDVEFRIDDGMRWLHAVSRPVRTAAGEVVWDEVVLDVTERKKAELALVRSEERARALMAEANRANRAKSEFLASMSHELRTPLNAILGFGQLLEMQTDSPLDERRKGYVASVLKGGHHLLSLIDDILELAKIEAGQIPVTPVELDAADMVAEVCGTLDTMAAARRVALRTELPNSTRPRVRADRTRLMQVLTNLGSNAVKYNRPGGSVTLVVSRPQPDILRFAVHDTGHGIPAERQSELFQPFNRLGAEATGVEGTGLGLALTRRLVEAMDGTIGFTSTPDVGSSFWVDLPAVAEPVQPAGIPDLRPFTLLQVSAEPAGRAALDALLTALPQTTLIKADTAERALELAVTRRPDIILLDIALPGVDGFTAMACLRTLEQTRGIPVVALSDDGSPGAAERGKAAGFRDWLTNPLHFEALLATFRKALSEK